MDLNWTEEPTGKANLSPFLRYFSVLGVKSAVMPERLVSQSVALKRGQPNNLTAAHVDAPNDEIGAKWEQHAAKNLASAQEQLPTSTLRLPTEAWSPIHVEHSIIPNAEVDRARPRAIPHDAVITIIIDDGMNPFHQCFRNGPDKSRVLVSWQQALDADPLATDPSLIFGREVLCADIENALPLINSGALSEDAAMRMHAMVTSTSCIPGIGMLTHGSHGMHTAGIAAGCDPNDEALDRRPVILINLPPQSVIGTSGVHLSSYVIPALERAFSWIDRLWATSGTSDDSPPNAAQWETVINLSYGQSAGPKDGMELFEREIVELVERRKAQHYPTPQIVMPVGNNNLDRSHVVFDVPQESPTDCALRIQPEDQTPTVVEFWTGSLPTKDWPLAIALQGPGVGHTSTAPTTAFKAHFAAIETPGGICGMAFARRKPYVDRETQTEFYRFQYSFILNPSLSMAATTNVRTPAGKWTLTFKNLLPETDIPLHGDIEVDQAARAHSATARSAYFVDPVADTMFDHSGRPFDVGDIRQANVDTLTVQVKQVGSHSSLAHTQDTVVVSGHRRTDGLPAPYAAAMHATDGEGTSIRVPNVSRVCDDGPATPGVLSAGVISGATQVRRGTSFAAAHATRGIVDSVINKDQTAGTAVILPAEIEVRKRWENVPKKRDTVELEKVGAGRLTGGGTQFKDRFASGFKP